MLRSPAHVAVLSGISSGQLSCARGVARVYRAVFNGRDESSLSLLPPPPLTVGRERGGGSAGGGHGGGNGGRALIDDGPLPLLLPGESPSPSRVLASASEALAPGASAAAAAAASGDVLAALPDSSGVTPLDLASRASTCSLSELVDR